MRAEHYAPAVLRYGLAILYLWFGLSQLADPGAWTSWVPVWATNFGLDSYTVVLLNGAFETIAGVFLAFGILVRWVSLVLALHLLIIVFDIGFTAIGIRDLGLSIATLALALHGTDRLALYAPSTARLQDSL